MPEGDDDEGGGHDRGDGRGPGGDSLQGPEVLEHGALPLGGGPQGGQRVVAGLLVRGRAGVLRGHEEGASLSVVAIPTGPSASRGSAGP